VGGELLLLMMLEFADHFLLLSVAAIDGYTGYWWGGMLSSSRC